MCVCLCERVCVGGVGGLGSEAWEVGVATDDECEHEQQAMAVFQRGAGPPPHSARTFLISRPN